MSWFSFRLADRRILYVEAGDESHAAERVSAAGFPPAKTYWGPFDELWEVSAKNRFCNFDNNCTWHDSPPKDKRYRSLYVKLEDHLASPDVVVLGAMKVTG